MRKIFILLIVAFSFVTLFAQKSVRVKASGSWVLSQEITLEQAEDKALMEAKKEALRKAGVPENVYAVSLLSLGNNSTEFYDISSELGRISIDGRVRIIDKTIEKKVDPGSNMVICNANITAEVFMDETEADPTFVLKVDGLKSEAYREKELLTFSVLPYQDCYLRIFWFGSSLQENGDMIFPIADYHNDNKLTANSTYLFPPASEPFVKNVPVDYEIFLQKDQKMEQNVVLIVGVKEKIPFVDDVSYENVIRWLLKIKKDKKVEYWYPIVLVK